MPITSVQGDGLKIPHALVPALWHSGNVEAPEVVKRSEMVREGRMKKVEHRAFSGP